MRNWRLWLLGVAGFVLLLAFGLSLAAPDRGGAGRPFDPVSDEGLRSAGWLVGTDPRAEEGPSALRAMFAQLARTRSSLEGGDEGRALRSREQEGQESASLKGRVIATRLAELSLRIERNPEDAVALNDRGVLRMRSFEADSYRLLEALADLRRARAASPRFLPARYNFAFLLQALSLRKSAEREWNEFLTLTRSGGPYAESARRQAAALQEPGGEERWSRDLPALRAASARSEQGTVVEIVRSNPQLARREVEERLILNWARATLRGDPNAAARELTFARSLGEALFAVHGDPWTRDLVASLHALLKRSGVSLQVAAAIHLQGGGLVALQAGSYQEAARLLKDSESMLEQNGLLWAFLVRCQRSYALFRGVRYAESLPLQESLGQIAAAQRYRALEATLLRYQGATHLFQGEPELAVEAHQRSLALFQGLGEAGNVVSSSAKVSDALKTLGRVEEVWPPLISALRVVGSLGDLISARVLLGEVSRALEERDLDTAFLFVEEFSRLAAEQGSPSHIALAQRDRAIFLLRLGREAEAEVAIRQALEAVNKIPAGDDREKALSEALPIYSEVLAAHHPRAALEVLNRALSVLRNKTNRWQEALVVLRRAAVYERLGELDRAEKDLEHAVRLQESSRSSIARAWNRVRYLDRSIYAYDELARFHLEHDPNPERSLEAVERSRGRLILDWALLLPEKERPRLEPSASKEIGSVLRDLPSDLVALEFRFLGSGLAVWRMERDRLEVKNLALSGAALQSRIERLGAALHGENQASLATFQSLSSELYRDLVTPFAEGLPTAGTLAIIPDGPLWDLPWSALLSPATGRFLAQDQTLLLSPSVAVLARPDDGHPANYPRALLVGSDRPDLSAGVPLRPLHMVSQEIDALARLYPGATILSGSAATRGAFLASLAGMEIVHFSGHTHDVDENPLRSALVLAMDPKTKEGGFLSAAELLGEALPETRLVVLSACRVAAGKPSRSEGRLNLALPFLGRGVRQVLVTQWTVLDSVARDFSIRFHRYSRSGLTAAAALRATKNDFLQSQDRRLRRPGSWAAFDLIGSL